MKRSGWTLGREGGLWRAVSVLALYLLAILGGAPCGVADTAEDLAEAARTYDLAAAKAIATELDGDARPEVAEPCARAHLLVAELLRIDFEFLPEDATQERRALGKEIDAASDAGLAAVVGMGEVSERYRITADLIGAKIRSTYRAGKYKDEMRRAIDQALAFDARNAAAWVSKAKMLVFRPDPEPAELREALELLEKALELDGANEQARLLMAHVHDLLGEREKAVAIWEGCIQENPECMPALRGLSDGGS